MSQPLHIRLYFQPALYEVARLVGYEGVEVEALRKGLEPLRERYGDQVALAVSELTTTDEQTQKTVLKPHVRKLCYQLLGPPPEKREEFHGPPAGLRPSKPKQLPPLEEEPLDPAAEEEARRRNKRNLLYMLRDARAAIRVYPPESHACQQGRKRLAAAEAELRRRGLAIPPEGEEIPKKK